MTNPTIPIPSSQKDGRSRPSLLLKTCIPSLYRLRTVHPAAFVSSSIQFTISHFSHPSQNSTISMISMISMISPFSQPSHASPTSPPRPPNAPSHPNASLVRATDNNYERFVLRTERSEPSCKPNPMLCLYEHW